jgi:hypothetical protein
VSKDKKGKNRAEKRRGEKIAERNNKEGNEKD